MTDAHAAALTIIRESLDQLRAAFAGLPDEAMTWSPGGETNSLAVLVLHSLSATRFLFGCSCGAGESITAYRQGERAAAFATRRATQTQLEDAIDAALPAIEALAARGTEETLRATVSFPEDPSVSRTGYGFLFHSIAHLREHAGQAQLMRDLWLLRA